MSDLSDLLNFDGHLGGLLGRVADGEDPMVLHDDGPRVADRGNDLCAYGRATDWHIFAQGDFAAQHCRSRQAGRDWLAQHCEATGIGRVGVADAPDVRPVGIDIEVRLGIHRRGQMALNDLAV